MHIIKGFDRQHIHKPGDVSCVFDGVKGGPMRIFKGGGFKYCLSWKGQETNDDTHVRSKR